MCSDLENQAKEFADRQVDGFDLKDLLPLSAVRDIIAEAYKQGYRDDKTFICYDRLCRDRLIVDEFEEETDLNHNDNEKL